MFRHVVAEQLLQAAEHRGAEAFGNVRIDHRHGLAQREGRIALRELAAEPEETRRRRTQIVQYCGPQVHGDATDLFPWLPGAMQMARCRIGCVSPADALAGAARHRVPVHNLMALSCCPTESCNSRAMRLRSISCAVISWLAATASPARCASDAYACSAASRRTISILANHRLASASCIGTAVGRGTRGSRLMVLQRFARQMQGRHVPRALPRPEARWRCWPAPGVACAAGSRAARAREWHRGALELRRPPILCRLSHPDCRDSCSWQAPALQLACNTSCSSRPSTSAIEPRFQRSHTRLTRSTRPLPSSRQMRSGSASTVHSPLELGARAMAARTPGAMRRRHRDVLAGLLRAVFAASCELRPVPADPALYSVI